VTTISSPGATANRRSASVTLPTEALPNAYATRLIPSVAFLVNTTSFGSAPTKAAMRARADS